MHYERLLILGCLAALAAGSTLGTIVALVCWRLRSVVGRRPARTRARLLFALRAFPSALGVVTMAGVALAFVRYEPRTTTEEAGILLFAAAGWAALLAALATLRGSAAALHSRRCSWAIARLGRPIHLPGFTAPAWRVDGHFPIAAVSGIFRSRLVISSRVLAECTAGELRAILRHECAHIAHRDNLARFVMLVLPDALGLLKAGDEILHAWHDAAEEAADDAADEGDGRGRVTLAAALVRVARMSAATPPAWMPALALYDGNSLDRRVRRLLDPQPLRRPPASERIAAVLVLLCLSGCVLWAATGPRPLHEAMEWAVRSLR